MLFFIQLVFDILDILDEDGIGAVFILDKFDRFCILVNVIGDDEFDAI